MFHILEPIARVGPVAKAEPAAKCTPVEADAHNRNLDKPTLKPLQPCAPFETNQPSVPRTAQNIKIKSFQCSSYSCCVS